MTVRVAPAGAWWHVERNGVTVSTHREKDNAVAKADSVASAGEKVVIHRMNGTIQDHYKNRR